MMARARRRAQQGVLLMVGALSLAGCGQGGPPAPAALLLAGPHTDITVAIPAGWHQVINSASPAVPEMVAPTSCMGDQETTCATGLARIASVSAPNAQAAALTVQQAVYSAPQVTPGSSLNDGPGKVGDRDGYRHRFTFTNPAATLTTEIAVAASGPTTPNAQGNREYSIILAWVSNTPGAPGPDVIDQIVASAKITGGQPPAH
jgi:hypothetical protein